MAEITGMTLTVTNASKANKALDIFKRTLKNKIGDTFRDNGYRKFEENVEISDNIIKTEDCYAFTSYEFEILNKEAVINIASGIDEDFTFVADEWSDQCGYEAFIEANYHDGILTYKFIASENMMGYCPEYGEDIVYYTDYDPSKTYTCPECGRMVTEEELFPYGVPTWEIEEIKIR